MTEDTERCVGCNAPGEKRPIVGFDENGRCLVCRDKWQDERQDSLGDRLRAQLTDGELEQTSLTEVVG